VTLWSGRLASGTDEEAAAFTESLSFDVVLWRADLAGSSAHVRGLMRAGLLTASEAEELLDALDVVAQEFATGTFATEASDEDIHTAVERRVTELAGPVGAKLHTARSRNDQVATDLRLWSREAAARALDALMALVETLDDLAEANQAVYLPGYTHLQRAQPVLLSHHLRAHCWALLRDGDRFCDAADRLNVSPLGAGALAGTALPIDPGSVASELGFDRPFANSLDAVSDRDFVAELCFCAALCAVHLSRMGEELVLWSSAEFGFCSLDDRFATGSSMLPQKKNPDVAELARGKAGRLIGDLAGVLATLKGLPLAYNRDLQEDTEPLFDAMRQLVGTLRALEGCYRTAHFDASRMAAAADDPFAGTVDVAEWLVERGMAFREAHHLVGSLVADAEGDGDRLRALVSGTGGLGPEAGALLAPGTQVGRRTSPGGAGPAPAEAQRSALRDELARLGARARTVSRLDP
jgi:argininosuccinate lyase